MALLKTNETDFGINATYHKVVQVNLDLNQKLAHVVVHSFIDADSTDVQPLKEFIYDWLGNDWVFDAQTLDNNGNIYVAVYNKLKSLPEWSGAQSV